MATGGQQVLRGSQEPRGHPSVASRNWVRAESEQGKEASCAGQQEAYHEWAGSGFGVKFQTKQLLGRAWGQLRAGAGVQVEIHRDRGRVF